MRGSRFEGGTGEERYSMIGGLSNQNKKNTITVSSKKNHSHHRSALLNRSWLKLRLSMFR
jgi:hypothetical protein